MAAQSAAESRAKALGCIEDKMWRLNNLYKIQDKNGHVVPFKMNFAQKWLFDNLWYRNIVLKARQLGFTTAIDLHLLDTCIFNSNTEAQIIAHRLDDAKKIFRRKIRFPYMNAPDFVRDSVKLVKDSQEEFVLSNGSVISVSVSARSGTAQLLHVSEFGAVCARWPDKAREIVTGAMEAVGKEGQVFIESTAEGRTGYFYEYCKIAQDLARSRKKLTPLDYKFHFFPWFYDPEYKLEGRKLPITQEHEEYFQGIESKTGASIGRTQKIWYVKKHEILGDDMKREYPSTPDEAFEQTIQGAYFEDQLRRARVEGRIASVPPEHSFLVDTWWDLGMNDTTAIIFTQGVGRECRIIDYYENSGEGLRHYKEVLDKKAEERKFLYGAHYGPHDIKVRELGTGVSRLETAAALGIKFEALDRVGNKADSIEAARSIFEICWFDDEHCDLLVKRLEGYRKQWDEKRGCYKNKPLHDENSNGADAFQTLAMGWRIRGGVKAPARKVKVKRRSVGIAR